MAGQWGFEQAKVLSEIFKHHYHYDLTAQDRDALEVARGRLIRWVGIGFWLGAALGPLPLFRGPYSIKNLRHLPPLINKSSGKPDPQVIRSRLIFTAKGVACTVSGSLVGIWFGSKIGTLQAQRVIESQVGTEGKQRIQQAFRQVQQEFQQNLEHQQHHNHHQRHQSGVSSSPSSPSSSTPVSTSMTQLDNQTTEMITLDSPSTSSLSSSPQNTSPSRWEELRRQRTASPSTWAKIREDSTRNQLNLNKGQGENPSSPSSSKDTDRQHDQEEFNKMLDIERSLGQSKLRASEELVDRDKW